MIKKKIPVVLSVAGFDPTCGAGVVADVKTFSYLGVYGLSVVSCVVVQNTLKVYQVIPISAEQVRKQLDVLFRDFTVDVVKIGLLPNAEVVDIVAEKIAEYQLRTVTDPVMSATSGGSLVDDKVVEIMKKKLLPITYVATPNIAEASVLIQNSISTLKDIENACEKLYGFGVKNVVIKGGHLPGETAVDVFFDGDKYKHLSLPKIITRSVHGTGCIFSAAITGYLAQNLTCDDSIQKAKQLTWMAIKKSLEMGKKANLLFLSKQLQTPSLELSEEEFAIWCELTQAVETIVSIIPNEAIPEVGMNIAYAKPNAKNHLDVCALSGRIVKTLHKPQICGECVFGGSKHVAAIVLAAQHFDPSVRCAINIRYTQQILYRIQELGLTVGTFNRQLEPKDTKSSMEWGTTQAIKSLGFVPDVVYDMGGIGKEPMIRILGANTSEIIEKLKEIWNFCINNR